MTPDLVLEIVQLEGRIGGSKELRKANGIPQLDGCPTGWLERYAVELRRLAAPAPVVVEEETPLERLKRRSLEMDSWWREQAERKRPNPYQVWRSDAGQAVRLIDSFATAEPACELARSDRPAFVYCGFDRVLLTRWPHGESGLLAAPVEEQRLRRAVDGTPLRRLRITRKLATEIAAHIGGMRIEVVGKKAVVRLDPSILATDPNPPKKRTRRTK
jgi:hypothetical protein